MELESLATLSPRPNVCPGFWKTVPITDSLRATTGSSLRRRGTGMCLASLLVITATPVATPESQITGLQAPSNEEPITPVPPPPAADPLKLALGERLFADPRLSRDGSRACLSCHDIHTNGADGSRRDKALDGSELPVNTSTIFNAVLSVRLNWEGKFRTLEAHAEAELESPEGLGTSVDAVLEKLN